MFDRVFDFLSSCIDWFKFWIVLAEYERGVILRLGKFNRVIGPGLHFFWPLGIEEIEYDNVVAKVIRLHSQTIETGEGDTATITPVVTYDIKDIRKALLDVEDIDDAVVDAVTGTVGATIGRSTWDTITSDSFTDLLTAASQAGVAEYGIKVIRVQLADIATARNFRVFMSK